MTTLFFAALLGLVLFVSLMILSAVALGSIKVRTCEVRVMPKGNETGGVSAARGMRAA